MTSFRVGISAVLLALLVSLITELWLILGVAVAGYLIMFWNTPRYGMGDNARTKR